MKVAFVYPNPRAAMLEQMEAGRAPDTGLLGQNHLHEHGIEARIHDPVLRRRATRRGGLLHRITWNLRELTLPWELGDADLACTPLATIFPLAARLRRKPDVLLISYHLCATFERSSPARRRLLRTSLRSAAGVVCIAPAARDRLIAQTGVDPSKVHTALLGVDERFWTPASAPEDGYVLTVGRDLARDYETFARAVERLPVRAIMVAGPPNLAGVDLPPNVEVRLDIGPLQVRELYAGAACVVVPIRREDYRFGTENSGTIALLEAMAMEQAVIVTERSTLVDYVRPGETALTVPAGDVAALRSAIERVLADRPLARSLGFAARRLVEERHTTRLFAERLATIMNGLAPAASHPASGK